VPGSGKASRTSSRLVAPFPRRLSVV
jgi:hypothetical protein